LIGIFLFGYAAIQRKRLIDIFEEFKDMPGDKLNEAKDIRYG
jgi:hypothetical protein